MDGQIPSYPVDKVNKVKRAHERGAYDHETVHAILDAAVMCHIAWQKDGQPFCTPTMFWREGTTLYWHGSSASRMIKTQRDRLPVCLTVTHLDSLIAARSGMHHSSDYRSVMAFGQAQLVSDAEEKLWGVTAMVDRIFPGRSAGLREVSDQELKATTFIKMEIEKASAKIRDGHVSDDEEDYALPIHAERIPVTTVLGAPGSCPRSHCDAVRGADLDLYKPGQRLDEVLQKAQKATFGEG